MKENEEGSRKRSVAHHTTVDAAEHKGNIIYY